MDYSYITTQKQLDELVLKIRECGVAILDTEFTRRVTYYPVLSLIQVAIPGPNQQKTLFIIDALSDCDLQEIFAVMGDEKILKILHSAKQDLQIFYKASNIRPQNVADTQIMANLANLRFNSGYSYLVDKFCGVELDKKEQNSDWQQRPLSNSQIQYALLDVQYLYNVYLDLKMDLEKMNRMRWFEEEMELFINNNLSFDNENLFKKFSFRNRSFREVEILKRLIIHREEWAKKTDVPRRHFLRDEHLDKMIKGAKMPKKLNESQKLEFENILKSDVAEEPKRSLAIDLKEISAKKALHKKAKRLIERKSRDFDVPANILLNSQQLKLLVEKRKEFSDVVFGWRHDILGLELKEIIES